MEFKSTTLAKKALGAAPWGHYTAKTPRTYHKIYTEPRKNGYRIKFYGMLVNDLELKKVTARLKLLLGSRFIKAKQVVSDYSGHSFAVFVTE